MTESVDVSDLKSEEETRGGSSPPIPTISFRKVEPVKESPSIEAYGTEPELRDWCQDCNNESDIIVRGYGYCDYHHAIRFCACKWPHVRCTCPECQERGKNRTVAGAKVKGVFKI